MDEENANYIEVKQGGRHLLDSNQFEYRVTKKKPNKVTKPITNAFNGKTILVLQEQL